MTTVSTWQQDQFLTPNRSLHRTPGDFYAIDEFLPSIDGQQLLRADSWGSQYDYPANFDDVRAVLWSHALGALVFTGEDTDPTPNEIGSFYITPENESISSRYNNGGPAQLDGKHKQNCRWIFGKFFFIGSDDKVYRTNSPLHGSAASVYDATEPEALLTFADTLWMIDEHDVIYQWDPDTSTFGTFFTPDTEVWTQFACHFRHHFVLFARNNDGGLAILQVDDHAPAEIHELTYFPAATGELVPGYNFYGQWGTPWTIHHDAIYFSPGAYTNIADNFEEVPIYRFNGSTIEHVDTVEVPLTPDFWGLVTWRDRVLLYFGDSGDQRVYVLHGGKFTQFLSSSYTTPDIADIYSVGGYLVMPTTDDQSTDGITLLRRPATTNTFTSAWLDMGHPASQKHLSRLVAIVSDAVADFKVKIEYRTEAGSWTTATEQTAVRHVDAGNLGVTFYMLQIRITFTDESGTYADVRLDSLAATYSYGVR